jgi:hypothetical protein
VIVTSVLADTGLVPIANVRLVAPARTRTLAGTLATVGALLESETTAPPDGAGPPSTIVPVEPVPPGTLAGFTVMLARLCAGLRVRLAVLLTPPAAAVRVTGVTADTDDVATENVLLVWPASTVMLPGTVALTLELERLTTKPPLGAAAVRMTLPVVFAPPVTAVGVTVRELSAAPAGHALSAVLEARTWFEPPIVATCEADVELSVTAAIGIPLTEPSSSPLPVLISRTPTKVGLDCWTIPIASPQGLNCQKAEMSVIVSLFTIERVARLTTFHWTLDWPVM